MRSLSEIILHPEPGKDQRFAELAAFLFKRLAQEQAASIVRAIECCEVQA